MSTDLHKSTTNIIFLCKLTIKKPIKNLNKIIPLELSILLITRNINLDLVPMTRI